MKETIVKINKTKSWFFEKINKIDKPLARLIKKRKKKRARERKKNQINKITNGKGAVTIDNAEYKGLQETIKNNYTAIKWITCKKRTNS